jgi:hypothetical protein
MLREKGSMKTFCGAPTTEFDIMTRAMIKDQPTHTHTHPRLIFKASILLCFHRSFSRAPLFMPLEYIASDTIRGWFYRLKIIGITFQDRRFFCPRETMADTRERDGHGRRNRGPLCLACANKKVAGREIEASDANHAPSRAHH